MIRQTLFTGWNLMRWLRLGMGIFFVVQTILLHDTLSGFIAAFLLFQAATNTGCCGVNGCAVPTTKKNHSKPEKIEFEEIKIK